MSDIQSISNGTYVIGDTSATNFIAGNGIKIDSPSAGTVRIGNDETVLWSGSTPTSAVELSESLYNFDSLKVYFDMGQSDRPKAVIEIQPNDNMTCGWGQGAENAYYTIVRLRPTDNTHLVVDRGKSVSLGNFTATAAAAITAQTGAAYQNVIKKVIGINRISGGNE